MTCLLRPLPVLYVRTDPRAIDHEDVSNQMFRVGASIKENDLVRCLGEECCRAVEGILDDHGLEHERAEWHWKPCMSPLEREIMRGYLKRFNDGLDIYRR